MRVLEQTPDNLVLQETPWGFRAMLLIFIVAFGWGLYGEWDETNAWAQVS